MNSVSVIIALSLVKDKRFVYILYMKVHDKKRNKPLENIFVWIQVNMKYYIKTFCILIFSQQVVTKAYFHVAFISYLLAVKKKSLFFTELNNSC